MIYMLISSLYKSTIQHGFLIILIFSVALLGFGFYLEYGAGLAPCPLCQLQRAAYILIGCTGLIAILHRSNRLGNYIYHSIVIMLSIIGVGLAGRQTWLQHLPADQVPECGPGLQYMLEILPLQETLKMVLTGSGECAEVKWRFIGLSIAEWSMICFICIGIIAMLSLIHSCINQE